MSEDEQHEPPLTERELKEFRELLAAKKTTKTMIFIIRDIAKYLAILAAGIAAYKYLFADWLTVGKK